MAATNDELQARARLFSDFLNTADYGKKLDSALAQGRMVVNINDIRAHDAQLADDLLNRPGDFVPALEKAVRDFAQDNDGKKEAKLHVGLEGNFGDHTISPRELTSSMLSHLVSVDGIITKCSLVRPKAERSVHFCAATGVTSNREYGDAATGATGAASWPTKDDAGNPLTTQYGLCVFRNTQVLSMQELPELAPPGQLPRAVDIIVEDNLVDTVKPGDRVRCVGIYRAVGGRGSGSSSGVFRTILIANNIRPIQRDVLASSITDADVANIKKIAKRKDRQELLTRSIAPSIYGHHDIKLAVLLQMLGGIEKNLESGTHLRGDINILLVGDPSTAKSQLLRFALRVAPLAISTTGRGATGVGLTAAVTSDRETGERKLEAGAMVLADRGVVCIDEFDKMSDSDRTAMHEVMEQQTVTIQKAGVHSTLNARCSVLAAANPVFGQYNSTRAPADNIGLPDSLLSRFDLLFITLDNADPQIDREIASHVLRMHRFKAASSEGYVTDAPIQALEPEDSEEQDPIDKSQLFGLGRVELLRMGFLRKFIHYARTECKPKLTEDACNVIADAYAELRNEGSTEYRNLPITARSLETLIRLSTAHAKMRLSTQVTKTDAEDAVELLRGAIFAKKETRRRKAVAEPMGSSSDGKRQKAEAAAETADEQAVPEPEQEDDGMVGVEVELNQERIKAFKKALSKFMQKHHADDAEDEVLLEFANSTRSRDDLISVAEMKAAITAMAAENKVMYTNGKVLMI